MKKYSNDKRVVFNPEDHSYFLGEKRLTSVTTFLSRFKNEFDSDYYSKRSAKKEGVTQEEILKRWKDKALKSTTIGTAIHKIFEDYVTNNYCKINGELIFDYDIDSEYLIEFNKKKKVALSFIYDLFQTDRLIPFATETIVYNAKLAGQIDCLCKDEQDNYYIIDFKTNEKIETNNYGKYYKHELNSIEESTMHTYCLQLSIYKNMLKDLDIKKLYLIHITEEKYQFIECDDLIKKHNLYYLLE